MSLAQLIHKKRPVAVATAIPAISATHGQERVGTVARIATVAVASPTEAQNDNGNSSRNSTNSSSKPCEQKTEAHQFWLLHFADHQPLTVAFSPAATHAEVLEAYPSALAAGPIEPGRRQPDTLLAGDQEAALLAWLAQIGETDQAIVAEVLALCRHDDDAQAYYLSRAGADPQIDDDRRRCSQCGNLRGAACIVAKPGRLVSAIIGYRPASPGVLRRCAGYVPNANDTDQRPGRERWPGLAKEGND